MSMSTIESPESRLPKRQRPRSSVACGECRGKKIRCDGNSPCTPCLNSGSTCLIINTDKRRRKSDAQVSDLKSQLLELEKSLAASQNELHLISSKVVGSSTSNNFNGVGIDFPNGSSSLTIEPLVEVESSSFMSNGTINTINSTSSPNFEFEGEENTEMPDMDMGLQTPWSVAPANLAQQVTGRYGRLSVSDGGTLRYYGATSSRHISFGGGGAQVQNSSFLKAKCDKALSRMNLLHPLVTPALEERLLQLYFAWHNPFFQIINEAVFYKHRELFNVQSPECQFYSPALLFAILSYTVHFSDEAIALLGTIPDTAGDSFMEKAQACLDQELDNPQTTTVQALSIMAGREAGCGRDARGWCYIGMAAMISIDLGLHKDATPWFEAGRLTSECVLVRNQTWWGMYCYGQLWSLYLGRPLVMLSDSDTPPPLATSPLTWIHVGDLNEIIPQDPNPLGSLSDQNLRGSLVRLLQITDSIVKQLYSTLSPGSLTTGIVDWSADIHSRLIDWKTTLSPSLKIQSGLRPLPHTIILHLQYHSTLILLHRPSLCDKYGKVLKDELSFRTCCSSAAAVTRLLEQYLHYYTFRRISVVATHQIFTAATINVFIIYLSASTVNKEEPPLRKNARKGLLMCITALAAIATTQVHARRCYLSIITLMRRWQISLDERPTGRENHYQIFSTSTIPVNAIPSPSPAYSTSVAPQPTNEAENLLDQSQQFERFSRELLALSDNYSSYQNNQLIGSSNGNQNNSVWGVEIPVVGEALALTPPSPPLVLHLNPLASAVDPTNFFDFDPYLGEAGGGGTFMGDWEGPTLFDMFTFPSLELD